MKPHEALRELSEPWPSGERVNLAIARAARLSGLAYWRASNIWYRKAHRVEPHEITAISDALQRKRELDDRNEIANIKLRIARLESRLNQTDEEFYRPTIEWLGKMGCRSS